MRTTHALAAGILLSVSSANTLQAEQVLFRAQDWVVSAPDSIDCTKPPVLSVRGPATLFEDKASLQAITLGIGQGLAAKCPDVTEAVLVSGRTRRLVTLPRSSPSLALPPSAPVTRQEPVPQTERTPTPVPVLTQPPSEQPRPVLGASPQAPPSAAAGAKALARFADRRLPSIESAKTFEAKCELLLQWMNRLNEEKWPKLSDGSAGEEKEAWLRQRAYLYRDEDFVQVFGRPYDQTTVQWRTELRQKIIGPCQGVAPTSGLRRKQNWTYVNQFQALGEALAPLSEEPNNVWEKITIAAIAKARQSRAWTEKQLSELPARPASPEKYRDLGQYLSGPAPPGTLRRGQVDEGRVAFSHLVVLWPSERKHFAEVIANHRAEVANEVAARWLAEIDAFGPTLADAQALVAARQAREDVLSGVSASVNEQEKARFNTRLDSILEPLVRQRLEQLPAIPATLAGVQQSVEWRTAFDRDFKTFSDRPPYQQAQSKFTTERTRILAGALPEWKQALNSSNPADENIVESFSQRLGAMFPPALTESSQRQYQEALAGLVVRQCDSLAALPGDPESPVTGVADDKLNTERAIASCELAMQDTSAPPRVQFQLARGYLATERFEEAIERLANAAEEGHGGALAYLAQLHLDGAPGFDANPELAYSLFERAAQAGFEPAKKMLAEFTDMSAKVAEADAEDQALTAEMKKTNPELAEVPAPEAERKPVDPASIDFTQFIQAGYAKATYNGELESVLSRLRAVDRMGFMPGALLALAHYLDAAVDFLKKEEFDPACPALVDARMLASRVLAIQKVTKDWGDNPPQALRGGGAGVVMELFGAPSLESYDKALLNHVRQVRSDAEIDMSILVYQYGGCGDVPVRRFYANARAFILKTAASNKQ